MMIKRRLLCRWLLAVPFSTALSLLRATKAFSSFFDNQYDKMPSALSLAPSSTVKYGVVATNSKSRLLSRPLTRAGFFTGGLIYALAYIFTKFTSIIPSSPCNKCKVSLHTSLSTVINIIAWPSFWLRLTCIVAIFTLLAPKSVPI